MCFQRAAKHILDRIFCNLCMVELFPCPYGVSCWSMIIHILCILFQRENPKFFKKQDTIRVLYSNRLLYSISKQATQTLFLTLFLGYWEMLLGPAACHLTITPAQFMVVSHKLQSTLSHPSKGWTIIIPSPLPHQKERKKAEALVSILKLW